MNDELSLEEVKKEYHGTFKSYMTGFFGSLILTLVAFDLVYMKALDTPYITIVLVALALVQAVVQLLYFIKLGSEAKPRWETLMFYFMVLVLLVIAIGSLWVMFDLDNRLMKDMRTEMTHD